MFVVPVMIKSVDTRYDTVIKQVWMLLERNGTHCISVESEEEAAEFAIVNEIQLTGKPIVSGPFVYLPVDPASNLSAFYLWGEIKPNEQPMKEAWRSFLWVTMKGHEDDVWGTNIFLKDILIAGPHSGYKVIEGYFKQCPFSLH